MITEPISRTTDSIPTFDAYKMYLESVNNYIKNSDTDPDFSDEQKAKIARMKPGSVVQPTEVHCVRELNWKLVPYRDYYNESKFQWELYNLKHDPSEMINLLKYKTTEDKDQFVANSSRNETKMAQMSDEPIVEKAKHLYEELLNLISKML